MLLTGNLTDDLADLLIERVTIDGREFWRDIERNRLLPVIRGGDGSDDDTGDDDDDTGDDDDASKGKTFTQAQVDRIAGRARKEAERATKKTIDEFLASQKSAADKTTMDEAARTKAEADEAKQAADTARAEAARERFEAKVERKLATAGVGKGLDDDKAQSALTRAVRLVDLDPDATDADIAAEIDALKADMPGLFGASEDDEDDADKTTKKKPASGVTTGSGSKKTAGTKTAMERGAEMYAARKAKTTTSTAA